MTPTLLSPAELADLRDLEGVVGRGLATFREVGAALREIQVRRLYLASHQTWEAYCEGRWRLGRAHAYRLITAAGVADDVSPIGGAGPDSEAVARPLGPLDAGDRCKAWTEAVDAAGGARPTAAQVQDAAARVAFARLSPEHQGRVALLEQQSLEARAGAAARRGREAGLAARVGRALWHARQSRRLAEGTGLLDAEDLAVLQDWVDRLESLG